MQCWTRWDPRKVLIVIKSAHSPTFFGSQVGEEEAGNSFGVQVAARSGARFPGIAGLGRGETGETQLQSERF